MKWIFGSQVLWKDSCSCCLLPLSVEVHGCAMQWILCAIYAIRIPWHARPPLGHELEMGSESSHGHLKNLGHARRRMSGRLNGQFSMMAIRSHRPSRVRPMSRPLVLGVSCYAQNPSASKGIRTKIEATEVDRLENQIRTTKITNMNLLHWAGHDSIPCQNPLRHK